MTKYRIREYWVTKKHPVTEKVEQTQGPFYFVEHRTIWTILFGKTWENLFGFESFRTAIDAKAALDKYLYDKEIKEEIHERIVWKQ